jgi:hypothetical protein
VDFYSAVGPRISGRGTARSRAKLKVIQGGKHDYDLADDDSTDSQRYLM